MTQLVQCEEASLPLQRKHMQLIPIDIVTVLCSKTVKLRMSHDLLKNVFLKGRSHTMHPE